MFYYFHFSLEKKELTIEKISNVITDTIMRFYDTNIHNLDAITLKTTLLFFLYSVCTEDKVGKSGTIINSRQEKDNYKILK